MIGLIIAIISGALMSMQGVFNTAVTKDTSIWISASFVQFSALIVCLLGYLLTGREGRFTDLFKVQNKYMLLGGVIGAFITYTVIKAIEILGPAKGIMLIVIAQLLVAYLIEVFGIFGVEKVDFEWKKLLGICVSIAGFIIFKWDY